MKPFLYYAAIESGLTASSTFLSEPTVFTFSDNQSYAPNNFANIYPNKPISMATAIAYSDNIYAVKTHLFLGEEALVDVAKRAGIKENIDPIPSLPLGTKELNMIDFLTGYTTLANLGQKVKLHLIDSIEDGEGNIIYKANIDQVPALNSSIVYILNELLTTTYDYNFIDYNYPSCIDIAPKMSKKYAVKSGSTDYDRWTIGYNKDILMGVWIGYDKNKSISTEEAKYSKNIWIDAIEGYLKDKPTTWYDMPSNVVGVIVDPITGKITNDQSKKKELLYYIKGTEPLQEK
jgi:membrane carboxypeptidase/penicillin-binding protein